MKRKDYFFFV